MSLGKVSGRRAEIVSISPPLGCANEPRSLPFACSANVVLAGGKSQTHRIVVRLPADADEGGNELSGRNCFAAGAAGVGASAPYQTVLSLLKVSKTSKSTPSNGQARACADFKAMPRCPGDMVLRGSQCVCPAGTERDDDRCRSVKPLPAQVCPAGWSGSYPRCAPPAPTGGSYPTAAAPVAAPPPRRPPPSSASSPLKPSGGVSKIAKPESAETVQPPRPLAPSRPSQDAPPRTTVDVPYYCNGTRIPVWKNCRATKVEPPPVRRPAQGGSTGNRTSTYQPGPTGRANRTLPGASTTSGPRTLGPNASYRRFRKPPPPPPPPPPDKRVNYGGSSKPPPPPPPRIDLSWARASGYPCR